MIHSNANRNRMSRVGTILLGLALLAGNLLSSRAAGSGSSAEADYKAAARFNSQFIKQFTYDTVVTPHWIGKTDRFWYSFRTSTGNNYYLVDPGTATKVPLFDHVKMASQLSELVQKPLEPNALTLTRMTNSDAGTKLTFVVEDNLYEYDLGLEKLVKIGKAPPVPVGPGRGGRGGRGQQQDQQQQQQQQQDDQRQQQDDQQQQQQQDQKQERTGETQQVQTQTELSNSQQQTNSVQRRAGRGMRGGRRGGGGTGRGQDYRNFSPDQTAYVYVKSNNLYYVEVPKPAEPAKADAPAEDLKKADEKKTEEKQDGDPKEAPKEEADKPAAASEKPADPELNAVQLTFDGSEDYGFGFGAGGGGFGGRGGGTNDLSGGTNAFRRGMTTDGKTRANVTWSTNSQSFYITRRDTRGVKDLFLVNSLSQPRPTLTTYKYAMPGEEAIRKSELYYFRRAEKKLLQVKPKWKDESYGEMGYDKTGKVLRFLHTDRLDRHAEYCELDVATGETKCLIQEGINDGYLTTQPVQHLEETDEMIWWSERSGWGHYYLYDRNGKLKNAITSGPYRAASLVSVDETNRVLYFTATGREPKENLNLRHTYTVRFDGGGLTLLDPGNADHVAALSPGRKCLVDNFSRVDQAPASVLRGADGKEIMTLEKADLSKLLEVGWKMPETFVVKAADGVTDLYGNLWKPFNFDPQRKYPIIVHVYPGPQMEGTTHTFAASGGEQQMAQLGFIVMQVGHRGGTPTRSKAYATYGYFNMRDYPLADKKSAVEQLAARFPYIDLDRVGIYGHSGGGFFTAAALLQKPYNEFFKVGVAESGNHDNNIYNNGWAERYNGMKEVDGGGKTNLTNAAGGRGQQRGETTASGLNRDPERAGDRGNLEEQVGELRDVEEDVFSMLGTELEEPQKADGVKGESQGQEKDDGQTKVKTDDQKGGEKGMDSTGTKAEEKTTKFEIHVATNAELAPNLKGHLLLMHGDMDNNVHPAGTLRLVEALIRANKRFDMLILPGKPHAYGDMVPYTTQRTWEYFAEHLLNDRQTGADIYDRTGEMPH